MTVTGARHPANAKVASTPALDYSLIGIVATLLALGLVEVYSASFFRAGSYYFVNQLTWVALGIGTLAVMASIPYRLWQRTAIPVMGITLLLLIAVLVFGKELLGARRTLLGGRLQPSEFAKLAVAIYVAAWVASKKKNLKDVRAGLVPFAIVMGIVGGLIVLERSFSVTIIILVTGITIFFLGGGDVRQLLITALIAAVVLVLLIYEFHYGVARIEKWWQALTDPNNAPYEVAQVHDMIRRGGGIGTRPENWIQKGYVPLLWSDYLFANLVADLKFPGALIVVVLFAALGYRGLSAALNAPDQFGALLCIGITTWLLTQAIIHMGTSVALIPATGIPLPFMSYGGSAMLASMAGTGLLLSISRASPEKKSAYANFGVRWWDRGTRLSNSGSGSRTAQPGRKSEAAGSQRQQPATSGSSRRRPARDDQRIYGDWRERAVPPGQHRRSILVRRHTRR